MKNKYYVIVFLLFLCSPVFSMTMLVKAKFDQYDSAKKEVILEGRIFKLNIDADKSDYDNEFDRKKELKIWQLKKGEFYYFNLYANPKTSNEIFNEVIFIADSEPGE